MKNTIQYDLNVCIYFNYSTQWEIITSIIDKKQDTCLIMATGVIFVTLNTNFKILRIGLVFLLLIV